jgi:general secretion pathway protein D
LPASSGPVSAVSPDPSSSQIGGNRAVTGVALRAPGAARVGGTFEVSVALEPDQPIMSVPMSLSFDPRLFEVTAVQEGDFMRQGGVTSNFSSRVDRATGQIFATGTRAGAVGASSPGTLLTLSVRAIAPGAGNFSVITLAPIGLAGRTVVAPVPAAQAVSVSP